MEWYFTKRTTFPENVKKLRVRALKIPWIANEDAFMWLLRYLPINIRI